jgi:putative endonuclease
MTNDLARRVWEHKEKQIKGFTSRYNITKLVYYEIFETAYDAISREKQIKAGSRQKKLDLINNVNPEWKDLYHEGNILPLG